MNPPGPAEGTGERARSGLAVECQAQQEIPAGWVAYEGVLGEEESLGAELVPVKDGLRRAARGGVLADGESRRIDSDTVRIAANERQQVDVPAGDRDACPGSPGASSALSCLRATCRAGLPARY